MDDGEIDQNPLSNPSSSSCVQGSSASVDSFIDELLMNTRTCTHTHTCNPPGPDAAAHTHTCYHTHTHVFSPGEGEGSVPLDKDPAAALKPRRPLGNREAVKKYREKKKAHVAYLEEEVEKLRVLNQRLIKEVQRQVVLEAEVARLRRILVDVKGMIGNELGSVLPISQKQYNSTISFKEGRRCGIVSDSGTICDGDVQCFDQMAMQNINIGENEKEVFP
ncbi:hypothetical protein Dimus_023113 [Dionaea muscipula]